MSEETVIESTTNEEPQVDNAVIKEAESQGWVPKERYRGDDKDWVDAETFVKRGREILPILRKHNENLVRELSTTKEQLKEFRQAAEEFKKFQKEAYERKAKEYEQQIDHLKQARAEAISEGDGQRVNALDDQIDEAKEAAKEARQASKTDSSAGQLDPPASIDPVLQTWIERNDWFGKDMKMTRMTNGLGEALRLENPNLKGQEFLEELDKALREHFPDKFGKRKTPSGQVESGSNQGNAPKGKKSYDSLPEEAKKACDRFVKQGLMTREQYVADYDWN